MGGFGIQELATGGGRPDATRGGICARALAWLRARSSERRLHLCETLSLGEKRSLAVVEYERERFLVACTAQSISLLRCLTKSGRTPASSDDGDEMPDRE